MTATLNSPNSWLFDEDDLRHTPSRADGISYEQEMYDRAFGVDLIVRVGAVRVDVPLLTIATASLFMHRFYMLESLKKYGAREVALACLFLAGKVEESLRKVDTVVNYCLRLEDRRRGKEPDVHPSSENFKRLVQQVLFVEEVVLVALQFDLTVVHPHPLLTRALKAHESRLSAHQLSSLGRAAWQILSDIYTTPLCICYETETLAAAAFLLAYTLLKEVLPALPDDWTSHFDIDWQDAEDVHEVDAVVQRITDLYTQARNDNFKRAGRELKQLVPKASSFMKVQILPETTQGMDSMALDQPEATTSTIAGPPAPSNGTSANPSATAEAKASTQNNEPRPIDNDYFTVPGQENKPAAEVSAKEYEQPPTPG